MSIRAKCLSTYARKNSGYYRGQMRFLNDHSAITSHIKIKAALSVFMSMPNIQLIKGLLH